jgi:hypothetical protein
MADPQSKAEVMALIDERWTELQQLIGGLSPVERERPLGDGWSAKVHLAHLAGWERSLLALLRGEERIVAMGLVPDPTRDEEAINAALAAKAAPLPFEEVQIDSNAVHADVVATLAGMSDDDLMKPYSHYQPKDTPYQPRPVVGWVNGNTWEHYEEHIGWLRAGLQE